ncbi:Mrp/NBP35 family ATP-binding protein [Paenibacillus yanchengensis]|uniref:Iron-sulfur cluster carrier protein n=1 Tax=Paenibacillus yanchengensis TaxID=2035833 RepID=A0ABW4YH80_9BACL
MLSREQAIEVITEAMAPFQAEDVIFRDVMVRNETVSLTVIGATAMQEEKVKEALIAVLVPFGVETVHCRFRVAAPEADEAGGQPGKVAGTAIGHGSNLSSSLLDPDNNVTFIAIASGKGGVGKSTVTVNLAVALARAGKRVGIIDADIYGFSVPDMMGIEERPEVINDKIIPINRFGVKVISMGFFVEDNNPIVWRGPMLGKMLRNFFQEIEWGEMDYILLDLPPGTGDIALDIHQMIPHSKEIIVTTPHATAAFVAARAGAMAIKTEHEIIGVVENMSYYVSTSTGEKEYVFGRGGGARLAETLNSELLAQIPLGQPENHPMEADFSPSVYKSESAIGQLYDELAESVISNCE